MLATLGKFNGAARMATTITTSLVPFAIVGGLLYAAFFVKAAAVIASVQPPAIERRDTFFGVAMPTDRVIWAAGSNGKVIRSDDGGQRWVAQQVPNAENLQGIAAWNAEQAVAVGGNGVILHTADAGKTWSEARAPKSEVANKLLNVRAFGNGAGASAASAASAASGSAWAVGEMGALLKTADFGKTWERAVPEKDQAWNDIVFAGTHGIVVGEFGQIMTSDDEGRTWQPAKSGVPSSLMSVAVRDAANAVAVGLSGAIVVTHDGGAQWTVVERQTREHLNNVIWDGTQWLAVGDKGVLLTGDERGTSWRASRVSEGNLGWNTQILRVPAGSQAANQASGQNPSYVLAGAALSRLAGGKHVVFGRPAD